MDLDELDVLHKEWHVGRIESNRGEECGETWKFIMKHKRFPICVDDTCGYIDLAHAYLTGSNLVLMFHAVLGTSPSVFCSNR